MTIEFNQIPGSIRKPGKYFEFNTALALRSLPENQQKLILLGQRLGAYIEPARFQGGTLNDATSAGTYTGTSKKDFLVRISTAAATDKFEYSTNGGLTWSLSETDLTGAAQALEDGVTITFGATTGHAVGDQWNFGAWPEPSVAEKVPTQVYSTSDVAIYFGYGSMAHLMSIAALEANAYCQLSVCALDDNAAGVQSTGDISFTGPATAAGTIKVWIGNKKIEISYAKDDTAQEIALAFQAKLEEYSDLPVMFYVDAAAPVKINFKARNAGTIGSLIGIEKEITANTGVGAAINNMASGATDPDLDDALTAIYAEDYDIIATPYNAQSDIAKLRDHLDSISGPLEQRGAIGVYAIDSTLANATTRAGQINSGMIVSAFLRGTRSISYEIGAAFASVMASEEDPARPLNTLELKGIHAPIISSRLSRTEQETCLYNGVSPLEVGPGEKVQIVRAISTYTKDAQSADDISLLDITTMRTLFYVREACRTRVALRFPRSKLSSKTPARVRSELLDVLLSLEELEIVDNVESNKDGLIVEVNATDPNRLDAKIPTDVVNGLHVLAGRIDLIL